MWPYLLVFLAALTVDTIPFFAPPAWVGLVILIVHFKLNPWIAVVVGVVGSTLGRYILTLYIPRVSSKLITHRADENLRYLGRKLGHAKWSAVTFIFCYTLTPLSTTALFTAAAAARLNPWHILPPFFLGRLITDGVMVYSGKYATENITGMLHGQFSIKTIITLIAGALLIGAVFFIDWQSVLEKRKFHWQSGILKTRGEKS